MRLVASEVVAESSILGYIVLKCSTTVELKLKVQQFAAIWIQQSSIFLLTVAFEMLARLSKDWTPTFKTDAMYLTISQVEGMIVCNLLTVCQPEVTSNNKRNIASKNVKSCILEFSYILVQN